MQAAFGLVVTATGLGTAVFNFLVDGSALRVPSALLNQMEDVLLPVGRVLSSTA